MNARILVLVIFICTAICTYAKPSKFKHTQEGLGNDVLKNAVKSRIENDVDVHKEEQCFYEVCDLGKPDMLNVHMVAHAHNDLGYKKTMDQYYYGSMDYILQNGNVELILDTVTMALEEDPARRFMFSEVGFLVRWWSQQTNATQEKFKAMVHDGRMELVMGGWGSNDEGTNYYVGMVDQMALGLKWLKDTFGEKCGVPKLAWQIDQFGQSREQTSLFAMMGFDGLFFGRISYQDKDVRMKDKTMELMWFGSDNLGDQASLFTGILFNRYEPPASIRPLEPVMDDPRLEHYNKDARVEQFIATSEYWSQFYSTDNIMMMLGGDFEFSNAFRHYKNLDKIIKYVNQEQQNGSRVNAIMSSPTCYLYALNQANETYTTKQDDFMPLESEPNRVWSGYFTSRSNLKRYERTSNGLLQACKQWDVIANLGQSGKVFEMAEEVAIMQHHDALTGTCRQFVAEDYTMRLFRGNKACQDVANGAFEKLLPLNDSISLQPPTWKFCDLLNASFCQTTESNNEFSVMLYNQLGVPVTHWVHIPVNSSSYSVRGPDLSPVASQFLTLSEATLAIPDRNTSISTGELVFQATIPPVGFSTYFVQLLSEEAEHTRPAVSDSAREPGDAEKKKADTVMENQFVAVTFDEVSGLLKSITNKEKSVVLNVAQTMLYYPSVEGENRSSVYQFVPNGPDTFPVGPDPVQTTFISGSLVQEFRQVYSPWVSQVFRLYEGARQVETEWTTGPIPVDDTVGKEIVTRFTTDLATDQLYYTDSNGREMIRRRRNYQPTWNLTVNNPTSVNYYPITTMAYIKDETRNAQLTVVTDRAHGGGSLIDGGLEIMIQRRLTAENSGVEEVFDELGITGEGIVTRGKMQLMVDTIDDSTRFYRQESHKQFSAPIISFDEAISAQDYVANFRTQYSAVSSNLPGNVHLMTLETMYENQILVRLEHIYEHAEDGQFSQNATVALRDYFVGFDILDIEELALGANKPLSAPRIQWNVQGYGKTESDMTKFVAPVDDVTLAVILKPMQIRTFLLDVRYKAAA